MRRRLSAILLAIVLVTAGCLAATSEVTLDPLADSDGDGLLDDWEEENGLDPLNGSDAIECMGNVTYCMRTYDDFTFAETHNSFATEEDGIHYPASNHDTGLAAQWEGGIRSFMLDVHHRSSFQTGSDDLAFCHGDSNGIIHPCSYGEVDAFDWLDDLRMLMDDNPLEIVTLLLENYVPSDHLEHLFTETSLLNRTWIHSTDDVWPTLGEMVLAERTLVIFTDSGDGPEWPWLHHAWTHSWDTPYGESNQDEMSCEVGRGDGDQPVWHLNNWLSNAAGLSDPQRAEQVNDHETLLQRALDCWTEVDDRPTFIAVDWWEDGDVVGVVEALNGMTSAEPSNPT